MKYYLIDSCLMRCVKAEAHRIIFQMNRFIRLFNVTIIEMNEEIPKVWIEYCMSGKKPMDIPNRPDLEYADDWLGWKDWLGENYEIEQEEF